MVTKISKIRKLRTKIKAQRKSIKLGIAGGIGLGAALAASGGVRVGLPPHIFLMLIPFELTIGKLVLDEATELRKNELKLKKLI
jgi:hypothetical protein